MQSPGKSACPFRFAKGRRLPVSENGVVVVSEAGFLYEGAGMKAGSSVPAEETRERNRPGRFR